MEGIWIIVALALGVYIAAKLTRFVNKFTFGDNRKRKELEKQKTETAKEPEKQE